MNKRNLLHISGNQYPSLNVSHHTKKIWEELAKAFNEYHIVARSQDNKFHHYKEENISLHLVPKIIKSSSIFLISSWYIFYLIKKFKITHLLAQSSVIGGATAAVASKAFKIPLMTEIHGEEYFNYFKRNGFINKLLGSLSAYTLKNSSKVRSLSPDMTSALNSNNISIKNVVLIPNRVNLSIFEEQKKMFEIGKVVKLISVGRFVKAKNYIQLMDFLRDFAYPYQLTLIGGGHLKSEYQNFISTNNIQNVSLIDSISQSELAKKIIQNDIYIQYSINEGVPRTILEAMALQMPIISSDAGLIKSVLINNYNSIVIPKNDKASLVNSLKKITEDFNFRKTLAENARKDVLEKYEWNKVFNIYRNELTTMKYADFKALQ